MKSYDLKLTKEELIVISEALMMAPYGKVAPVVESINKQIAYAESSNETTATASPDS